MQVADGAGSVFGTEAITTLDELWARYDAAVKPTGSAELAFTLGAVSYAKAARVRGDWGDGLVNRSINILDLNPFKNGWMAAKAADGGA